MVAAGEAGGILDTILMRLATFMEKNDALVRKVKGAMIYPGVIMSVAGDRHQRAADLRHPGVREHVRVGRPGAAAPDAHRDRAVEVPTRVLVGSRRCAARSAACSRSRSTTPRRTASCRSTARCCTCRSWATCCASRRCRRFTRTLGTLISSGVSILDGLEITAKTAGNRVIQDAIMASPVEHRRW